MKDDDMATRAGNTMAIPTNALAKTQVVLFMDGSVGVHGHPDETAQANLLKMGLDLLGYDVELTLRNPLDEGELVLTEIFDPSAEIVYGGTVAVA
jgi:hypothetical protein